MHITPEQQDALTEIVNIGFGRAAAALSSMIGQKILLEAPLIQIEDITNLSHIMRDLIPDTAVIVRQSYHGGLSGDVVLFMAAESASALIDLLSGGRGAQRRLTASDREALIEVGNILLNAYVGSFGNLLNTHIVLSVPSLHASNVADMLNSMSLPPESHHAFLVKTEFKLLSGTAGGYVALIIDADGLGDLIQAVRQLGLIE
jgi:chemotaxis protein CheC